MVGFSDISFLFAFIIQRTTYSSSFDNLYRYIQRNGNDVLIDDQRRPAASF